MAIDRLTAATSPGSNLAPAVLTADAAQAALDRVRAEWAVVRPDVDLGDVTIEIAGLPNLELGRTAGTTISVDATAAGWGWAVMHPGDDTPRMDLTTVVRHELGHVLGYEHGDEHGDGLMAPTLAPGESRAVPAVASAPAGPAAATTTSAAAGSTTSTPEQTTTATTPSAPSTPEQPTTTAGAPATTSGSASSESTTATTGGSAAPTSTTTEASPSASTGSGTSAGEKATLPGPANTTLGNTVSTVSTVTIVNDHGAPLEASSAPAATAVTALTSAELDSVVEQAKVAWISARLGADFAGVTVSVGELDGLVLGVTGAKAITIDATAAGWGWTLAGGQMDLLTVVLHELGHVLGLEHGAEDSLMGETLAPNETHGAEPAAAPAEPSAQVAVSAPSAWTISLANGRDHVVTISAGDDGLGVTVDGLSQSRPTASVLGLSITGGDGADTFVLHGSLFPLSVPIVLDGSGGRDVIRGPPANTTWNITGAGSGTVSGVSFAGIEDISGAADNEDTVVFGPAGSLAGIVDGGAGGFDTVEISANGGSLTSTITGPQSGTITRGSDLVSYTGMEPISFSGGTALVLNAPNGATVTFEDNGNVADKTFVVDFNGGGETHAIMAADTLTSLTLNLGTGTNSVTINALDPAFVGTLTIQGSTGDDTVTFVEKTGSAAYTFNGGAGTDTLVGPDAGNTWTVTGTGAGSLNGELDFTGVENLTGGAGADTFTIATGGSVSGIVDGGTIDPAAVTLNAIDFSARTAAVSVNLDTASATGVTAFTNVNVLIGSTAGTDTLTGSSAGTTFLVTGVDAGIATFTVGPDAIAIGFSGFENLTGGVNTDVFAVAVGGSVSGTLNGGLGADTLFGPDQNSSWLVNGANAGILNGATHFTGIETLVGGTADDLFTIATGGSIGGAIDGGAVDVASPSVDTLDYSSRPSGITVNLQAKTAPGVASFSRIDAVVGTSSTDTLVGPLAKSDQTLWSITGLNRGTVDGVGFVGFENLTGQDTTSDAFVFAAGSRITGTIAGGSGAGVVDGFAVRDTLGLRAYQPTSANESGTKILNGSPSITYTGMDVYTPVGGTAADRLVSGSIFDRSFEVADSGTIGQLQVTFHGLRFTTNDTAFVSTFTLARPTSTLTVTSGTGADTSAVAALSPAFAGAVITYSGGVLTARLTANDDTVVVAKHAEADNGAPLVDLTAGSLTRTFGVAGAGVASINVFGLAGNDTFTIVDAIAAAIQVFGGDGVDMLLGPNSATEWTIDGADSGSGGTFLRFDSVEQLTGGTADDIFRVTGSLSGALGGGAGGLNGGGGAGVDTLVAGDVANTWTLTGAGAGTMHATADTDPTHVTHFAGFENLRGGSDIDNFSVATAGALSGILDGGAPGTATVVDTVDFTAHAAGITIDLQTASGGGIARFANIGAVVGTSGAGDTLRGPAAFVDQVTWVITAANAGTVDGLAFSRFENLTGRDASNDAFVFAGGSISGTVAGGAGGSDGFAVVVAGSLRAFQPAGVDSAGTTTFEGVTVTYTGLDLFTPVVGTATNRVVQGSIFDRPIVITDLGGVNLRVTFQNLSFGTGAVSSFDFVAPTDALWISTGTGTDTITSTLVPSYALITYAGGVLTALLRNTGADDTAEVALDGVGDAALAADDGLLLTLTVNGFTRSFGAPGEGVKTLVIDGRAGKDTIAVREALPIAVSIAGGAGTDDTLEGPIRGTEWTIDGANSGSAVGITSFSGIENLVGGSSFVSGPAIDIFRVVGGGSISGTIDGGLGIDILVGPDQNTTWDITGADAGTLGGTTHYVNVESLTGGSANDVFRIHPGGSVSGALDGGLDVDTTASLPVPLGIPPVDTLSYATFTGAVTVNLGLATAPGIAFFTSIDSIVGGTGTGDTLLGPGSAGDHVTWRITGANAGEVDGLLLGSENITKTLFSSFENLKGRGSTNDSFLFAAGGSLSGILDGGTGPGTVDGFAVSNGSTTTVFVPPTPAGTTPSIFGRIVTYGGMEGTTVLSGDDVDRVIDGSVFDDTIELEADAVAGKLKVTFVGLNFWNGISATSSSFSFVNPSTSLTIQGGSGGDTITVKSLDAAFSADLKIYGNKAGAPTIEPDAGKDTVTFDGNVSTNGGYLEVFADVIVVSAGRTLSTLSDDNDLSSGNDIVFRARRIGTPEIENLLPVGYLAKKVEITIGDNAVVKASSIYLITQAEDRALATTLGLGVLTTLGQQMLIDPIVDVIKDLVSLPIKVIVKASEAKVTIGTNAQLLADYTIGIYATAGADASGQAKSQLFSLGYSQADATATIEIKSGAVIDGRNGPVNITSDASATASMSTETSREKQGEVPGKKSSGFAASLAVSWARLVSRTTVAEGAYVHAGRTVNIRALGETESEAEAESSLYADGTAAIALSFQFSTADVLAQVGGRVTADMNTSGGEVVKFEFDPTVPAANWKSSDTPSRLKTGETVQVLFDVDASRPSGTIFKYLGGDITAGPVNLSAQTYSNTSLWEVTTEPWGYVDYAKNRISVFNGDNDAANWVVLTEDTVDYSPRRGTSIGGLPPGTYVVILLLDDPATAVDESHYIQLARTEQQAIDGIAIDLTPGATTNTRSFDASDIEDDTITFGGVGNTFELGQAVIYREPGRTDYDRVVDDGSGNLVWQSPNASIDGTPYVPLIAGLEHGGLYYVMAGTNQFNLGGDQRLVPSQAVQLGALENETRGGIARVKLGAVAPGTTGFTLSATQILDSTFLTFGVVSALSATDKSSATAGLAAEEKDKCAPGLRGQTLCRADLDQSIFDTIFNKASATYGSKSGSGGSNAKASLQIGGGLAFSYTDHNVRTWITNTADLNSNDDMELTSGITEELTLKAESSGEEQPGKKKKTAKNLFGGDEREANTSADSSVSLAIIVGIQNNRSRAVIGCSTDPSDAFYCANQTARPTLDSMRALRLLSGVTYPFLTRPDEFVPTSFSEFWDKIQTEGFDYVNTYLDGTLGLSSLFNTSARATTSADKMAFAASINVLVFTNVAESIVHSGAKINQDPFYRPDPRFYLVPGDPGYDPDYAPDAGGAHGNDNVTHSANANNVDEHVVSIEATNYMQFMNVTGVFGFKLTPSLELSSPLGNGVDDVDTEYKGANSLTPTSGGKGGVGGAIFLQFLDNKTHAIIEQGVELYSGRQSGLNMKAEEAIMGFAFSQAGASSGKIAVGGTFAYFQQTSDTLAQLQEGSVITGGRVDVYAGSLETLINWAGGVAQSKAIGVGFSIAINNTSRTTRAVIGQAADTANPTPGPISPSTKKIDVVGAVTSRASVAGGLYTFTVAGSIANASGGEDEEPADGAGGNAPAADDDPLDGVSLPLLFGEDPPADDAKQKKAGTSVAVAAAVAVNHVTDVTQASLADYVVTADAVDVKASNQNDIISATGGLAFSKTDAGGNAVALAGAFSYNGVDATTDAFVRDSTIRLRSVAFDDFVVEGAEKRFSLTADTLGDVWTLAAGGGGALSGGGKSNSDGGSFAASLAGAVSWNEITGKTRARMFDSTVDLLAGAAPDDARVRASDDSTIFAIAGALSLAIAEGGQGKATAVAFGLAIAVNSIVTDTDALIQASRMTWATGAPGGLVLEATSSGSIQAYTVAGALAAAVAKQSGSGVGAAGAGAGSVNKIDADTTAVLRTSTVGAAAAVTVRATNESSIIAGAGAIAIGFAVSGKSTAAAVSIGGAFAVNLLHGGSGDDNQVLADVDHSTVTAGGPIAVAAEMRAGIFTVGIGAAGSVAGSNTGSAFAVSVAGSIGVNEIRNVTLARVRTSSTLTTTVGSGGAVSVTALDDSWINATAGAVALSLAFSQKTAVAPALGLSLTFNNIQKTTRAAVENSTIASDGAVTVLADSNSRIDSLGFGIALAVAISLNASAIGVGATGAVSFNKITSVVDATIMNTSTTGTATVTAKGPITVTASDDSTIEAIAIAASASISGSTSSASVAISIGIALAHNRINKQTTASVVDIPSVSTPGAVIVGAHDTASIEVTSVAAALAVALGIGTSVGVAGGASESTNVILSRTSASIEGSNVGTTAAKVASVDVGADSSSRIKAIVGAVAASVAIGNNGVAVAIGIGIARNFIGYDPYPGATYDVLSTAVVDSLSTNQRVKITGNSTPNATPSAPMNDDVFQYIGTETFSPRFDHESSEGSKPLSRGIRVKYVGATGANGTNGAVYEFVSSTPRTANLTTENFTGADWRRVSALEGQDYLNPRLWKQVNVNKTPVSVQAFTQGSSIQTSGMLHVHASGAQVIDAIVFSAALGIAAGVGTGVGVSGAGVYAENRIVGTIKAFVNGTGSSGITAGSVRIDAADASQIHATAIAASLAVAIGGDLGVAIAIGLTIAFNEVDVDVDAHVASGTVTTAGTGTIEIKADTSGATASTSPSRASTATSWTTQPWPTPTIPTRAEPTRRRTTRPRTRLSCSRSRAPSKRRAIR